MFIRNDAEGVVPTPSSLGIHAEGTSLDVPEEQLASKGAKGAFGVFPLIPRRDPCLEATS